MVFVMARRGFALTCTEMDEEKVCYLIGRTKTVGFAWAFGRVGKVWEEETRGGFGAGGWWDADVGEMRLLCFA